MPGRAVVTSPGGTAAISIPSDPNFMWTGLETCAPFFGSMKNTLAFLACAPAETLNAPMIATTSSASCFRLCMVTLLWPDILAARSATPSAFERRCIPAGCVAPSSNIPDILSRRALPSGRLAVLGATMDLHHGLLMPLAIQLDRVTKRYRAGRARTVVDLIGSSIDRMRGKAQDVHSVARGRIDATIWALRD